MSTSNPAVNTGTGAHGQVNRSEHIPQFDATIDMTSTPFDGNADNSFVALFRKKFLKEEILERYEDEFQGRTQHKGKQQLHIWLRRSS